MGEFARFNGARIKIGTCENLYYLRWEDRFKVEYDFGNHKWNWRLPWPDEDQIKPGEYPDPFRGALLVDFTAPDGLAPGYIHIRHECGLLINAPCFHGRALPPPRRRNEGSLERPRGELVPSGVCHQQSAEPFADACDPVQILPPAMDRRSVV